MDDDVVVVSDLRRMYDLSRGRRIHALSGVSFVIRRGELFGLLGPNGAGTRS